MRKTANFAGALLLGVLVAMTPNVGTAQELGGAKKSSIHKSTDAAKKPGGVKRRTTGKPADGARQTGDDEVSRLEKAEARLRKDMQRIGGGRTPAQSIGNVRGDISRLRVDIERLERAERKSGMTSKEIEAQRKKFENRSIFNASDVPTTAGTTTLQEVGKKALSKSAGKWLGWYGWLLTAADYGARYKIKQDNIARMEHLLKQENVNREELFQLTGKLYKDLSDAHDRLIALKEMRALYDKVTYRLAKAREPARSHAILRRVEDTAGDEEEIRKAKEYGKKHMVIEPADGKKRVKQRRVKRRRAATHRPARPRLRQNRYREDPSADGGGE